MKYFLFLLFVSIAAPGIGQETSEVIIKPRLSFVSGKQNATDTSKYVIINKDTFYSKYKTDLKIPFSEDNLYSNEKFLNRYRATVFMYSDENSKIIYELKQWATPIVVYLDKKLPKTFHEQFKKFYSQIKDVNNFKISFASKLEDANYYIKVTSSNINGYADDFKFYNEKDRLNSIFTGATYALQTDNNNKFYSGILTINPTNKNDGTLLKQLKQVFYMSLGNFQFGMTSDPHSILSKDYDNANIFFDFDLNILKAHYALIYDQKINGTTFSKLYKLTN